MAYEHSKVEKEVREKWKQLGLYQADLADTTRQKYYLLTEFPYPSGDLHIGHWYAFAVTDIYARLLRAKGYNVLFPIGFDAFGLPAENAAIKNKVDPKEWTHKNIERMRAQLETMGASFDWSKEINACDPSYHHWTQWLFSKLFEHGLAERKEASVKWCPSCQTVLANEQVIDGHCERCGTPVTEKVLTQWFLKITQYADRLLSGLSELPWREEIKEAQRAWIGKSDGAKLKFELVVGSQSAETTDNNLPTTNWVEVFTTRPDTIFGATYLVLAPEHALVQEITSSKSLVPNKSEIEKYVSDTKKKTERERSENKDKTGVKLEGVAAINPATKEEIPIYVADYVLGSYGTGAVMAVPAHDERDFEFAQKYGLPIRIVVEGGGSESAYTGAGSLVNSGEFTGRKSEVAKWEIIDWLGGSAERATQYRIRDWSVSRQRYWGCPIPIVYDPEGNPHAVPAEHLPWLLPTDVDFTPLRSADLSTSSLDARSPTQSSDSVRSPLASSEELRERVTRIFGEGWTPEYDTLDTFVDSSWYFTRYLDPKNPDKFSDTELMKRWLPVDRYSGGSEHTTMHLLYARFFTKALFDLGLVPFDEPFVERFNRGLIMGPDGQKMSKSKGNVINPDEFVQKYGADAVRVYLAFIGPYNEPRSYPWSLEGVASMRKFLDRVVRLVEKHAGPPKLATNVGLPKPLMEQGLAKAARKVEEESIRFKFNTAVAALMILLNELEAQKEVSTQAVGTLLVLLAPFAPHLAEHLWEQLGREGSVHQQPWPAFEKVEDEVVEVVVQVNGRRRGSLRVAPDLPEEEMVRRAQEIAAVSGALAGKPPARVVYVPGRIINLVA